MNLIKVDIDAAKGTISVWNNGGGIPIEIHKEHGCYVPELIFGKYNSQTYNLQANF
jgi:DNA topoisomerase-2